MKDLVISFENIYGLQFGAALITQETFEEYQEDEILEDRPFEITDSFITGPLFDNCIDPQFKCVIDKEIIEIDIADIPAFNTNKEIDGSGLFTKEQATFIKKSLKRSVNDYYSAWRAGQRPGEEKLLEVEERGSGSMIAYLDFQEPFNKDNFFFVLADTLPDKETVISGIGYKNPDDSISEANFEYDLYSYYNPTVKYDSEDIC